jgi:Domain of unknown function (DUF1963)
MDKDRRVIEVIRQAAREAETPAVVVEAVIARSAPSIRLLLQAYPTGTNWRLGGSRIGGLPDLPEDVDWARLRPETFSFIKEPLVHTPMSFLMQINLAEIAPFDVAHLLPRTGILTFFFRERPGGWVWRASSSTNLNTPSDGRGRLPIFLLRRCKGGSSYCRGLNGPYRRRMISVWRRQPSET